MSQKLRFEIYFKGTVMRFQWRSEEDDARGKRFLNELVGGPAGESHLQPGDVPFYYFDTEVQMDAFFTFRQKLRDDRHKPS